MIEKDLIDELAEAAGETHWRRVAPLELNEVSLNGSGAMKQVDGKMEPAGGYFRKRILTGNRNRNEKPAELDLGKSIKIVFLRKRRKLVERGGTDGKILRATNEHNHPKEAVTLFDTLSGKSEDGIAGDLRTKYGGLRTVELIYALLITDDAEPELVRIPVKGSSLGSDAKADTTTDLYKYMSSFSPDEHMWEYYTILTPVFEQGKMSYFAIDFKRGDRVEGDVLGSAVAPWLRVVRDNVAAVDRSRQEKIAAAVTAPETTIEAEVQEEPAAKYPEDDINPDDIPF
jgi:hypothetical protein